MRLFGRSHISLFYLLPGPLSHLVVHKAVYRKYGTCQFIANIHLYTSSVLDFRVGNISLCHLIWPSVSRTSVFDFRLREIRLCLQSQENPLCLPSRGHPSELSITATYVLTFRLRVICLGLPCRGHPTQEHPTSSSVSGTSFKSNQMHILHHPSQGSSINY